MAVPPIPIDIWVHVFGVVFEGALMFAMSVDVGGGPAACLRGDPSARKIAITVALPAPVNVHVVDDAFVLASPQFVAIQLLNW